MGSEGRLGEAEGETLPAGKKCTAQIILGLYPWQVGLLVVLMVILGETVSTLILSLFPPLPGIVPILVDSATHLLVFLPAYFFLFLPLRDEHAERRRAEREVSFLSRHVIRAVEEEKKRLAHDLHDECGQVLTALQCRIEALKCSLPEEALGCIQQCDQLAGVASQMGDHVRGLTARLRPAMLESCGIIPTLQWHVDQIGRGVPDLRIDLQADWDERLPAEVEITLYRLCQEGLNNIVRHARARRAQIRLSGGERVRLRIEDDGVGFDLGRVRVCEPLPQGFGLLGMRERVADLGGKLAIRSAPGRGTVIEAELPLRRRKGSC